MSLYSYLVKSNGVFEEMRWDFSPEEIQQLYTLLKELGFSQYRAFVQEHLQEILKYISLSPSQRKQKKWVNHPDILLIRMAALQISFATVQMCCDIQEINDVVNQDSYRKFHAVMAAGLAAQLTHPPFRNFFRDYDNPFS
jgi:hypothetical protein